MKKIPLTQGKYAIVDDEDYEWLSQWKWFCVKVGGGIYYAARNDKKTGIILMHRQILKAKKGETIDHKNRNSLDNRKKNIRFCNHSQNAINSKKYCANGGSKPSSDYKGVWWDKNHLKWSAMICCNYKKIWLGRYSSEIEAAKAYDRKAKELFGEFAYVNVELTA